MENGSSSSLPAIPGVSELEMAKLFALAPLPPSPLVGVNPQLDRLTGIALAGNTHIAATYAHAFNMQHQLLTYAMHLRNSTQDEVQRNYLDRLIYHLMQVANQGLMQVANEASTQIRALLNAPEAPEPEPVFSWKRFWLEPGYIQSEDYKRATSHKSLLRRLWED